MKLILGCYRFFNKTDNHARFEYKYSKNQTFADDRNKITKITFSDNILIRKCVQRVLLCKFKFRRGRRNLKIVESTVFLKHERIFQS